MLLHSDDPPLDDAARSALRAIYLGDERRVLQDLLPRAALDAAGAGRARRLARRLAEGARHRTLSRPGSDALLHEYDLSSEEGVLLMCLAEALLRIPDGATAERLIRDNLARGRWDRHLGHSQSALVNASTWGLLLTGRMVSLDGAVRREPLGALRRLASRIGEPTVRLALRAAMGVLARQFVLGRTMSEALDRSESGTRYSYDRLGEAARTAEDAEHYLHAYREAIAALAGRGDAGGDDPLALPGISVKLSALHPRYEYGQRGRLRRALGGRLLSLVSAAREAGVAVTLDAEEAERLELSLDLFQQVARAPGLSDWQGFGLAVQAYQKRARPLLGWIAELAGSLGHGIPVRLVKGAYWDTEIKRAQQLGLEGYPVFTRKSATDVSYLACARFMLEYPEAFHCQFATHNAYTLAWLTEAAGAGPRHEFQRLHGMGEALYAELAEVMDEPPPCRVYAPVGDHDALLPYLVRRLLENGANTSFVNQLASDRTPLETLIADPVEQLTAVDCRPHPRIALPEALYGSERRNSRGIELTDPRALQLLDEELQAACEDAWQAGALVDGNPCGGEARPVTAPADRRRQLGSVREAGESEVAKALDGAAAAAEGWDRTPADRRAHCLEQAAELFERHRAELIARVVHEGGRTLADAVAELREAVDYCRYYAAQARRLFGGPHTLPGPTGERNELSLHGRGVFACISPWNFPLAIFTGQVVAALAAGNAVIAKPARQTPLTALRVVELLHAAGIPPSVLQLLPGSGAAIGTQLLDDERVSGVVFTGSTETAWTLQSRLAARRGPIVPLIAETGGQNAMIVDSSALTEQVTVDVLQSAFDSAGQRCSALRVLFLQEDIAERQLAMLAGAMDELVIGDPLELRTDVGPVIDDSAREGLQHHAERMRREGRIVRELALPGACAHGSYVAPMLVEIDTLKRLTGEVFGPVLHVVRYHADALDAVIDAVNGTGYGLTLGVHSRIEATWQRVRARARVGNLYVNRNMVGAVVGVQPFGGEGLSGSGPKAGGPHYLPRFALERAVSVNTTAMGGNASLLGLDED